jgi:hypothetical protein
MTDAKTAQRGGFMMLRICQRKEEMDEVKRFEGTSVEFMLKAGKDVNDSREVECEERGFGRGLSTLEVADRLVEK